MEGNHILSEDGPLLLKLHVSTSVVGYFTTLSAARIHTVEMQDDTFMTNSTGFGRKLSWPT
jgi:hypothetical protein